MPDDTACICPLPGLGVCVQERCNFWDDQTQECTSDCYIANDPGAATANPDLDTPGVISCYEDYD